jgi:phosphatidylglycerophosphate synthase
MKVVDANAEQNAPLVEVMNDPLNRFFRYPVANALLPLFKGSSPLAGVSPNQVTYFHTGVGVAAAAFVAHGSRTGLIIAFVLSEIRFILDCFDGVLARSKKISSPYGRTLDALGDAVSYIALCIGVYLHIQARTPAYPGIAIMCVMMATGGLMAWVHDFYKRKFATALKSGADAVYDDLLAKHRLVRAQRRDRGGRGAGFVTKFGFCFDWMQVVLLQPAMRREMKAHLEADNETPPDLGIAEVQYIVENAHARNLRAAFRAISLMSGDNVMAILNVGLLVAGLASVDTAQGLITTEATIIVYGFCTLGLGIFASNLFLHGHGRGRGRARGREPAEVRGHTATSRHSVH